MLGLWRAQTPVAIYRGSMGEGREKGLGKGSAPEGGGHETGCPGHGFELLEFIQQGFSAPRNMI